MSKLILAAALFVGLNASTYQQTVFAQTSSGGSSESGDQSETFEARFWQYLLSNNYKNWAPPAGQDGGFFEGSSTHGQLHKLYLNRTAASDPDALVDESVVVMENYSDSKILESISVMLRSAGSNPLQEDWYWITYGPDGSIIGTARENNSDGPPRSKPNASFVSTTGVLVTGSGCTKCHREAPGNDFVYFNSDDAALDSNEVRVELTR